MKRILVFLTALTIVAGTVFAEESVLIDFNELLDDYQGEHLATLIDFSANAGTRFTEEEKAAMNTSLYIPNWEVRLSSSSRTVSNDALSHVAIATVGEGSPVFPGQQVLGVRVRFPTGSFNSYAWVKPPFEIPVYATSAFVEDAPRNDQFSGFGVVKNVGVLKSVKVNVRGTRNPMGLAVVVVDDNEQTTEIPMGYLDFEGWKELVWQNPNYVADVRNRDLRSFPLYPTATPSVVLDSIQFFRDAMQDGGDFICYVKDISVVYDQAVIQEVDTDLNHEDIWGILAEREVARRNAELRRLANKQVLRYLEEKRMHQEPETIEDAQQ